MSVCLHSCSDESNTQGLGLGVWGPALTITLRLLDRKAFFHDRFPPETDHGLLVTIRAYWRCFVSQAKCEFASGSMSNHPGSAARHRIFEPEWYPNTRLLDPAAELGDDSDRVAPQAGPARGPRTQGTTRSPAGLFGLPWNEGITTAAERTRGTRHAGGRPLQLEATARRRNIPRGRVAAGRSIQ